MLEKEDVAELFKAVEIAKKECKDPYALAYLSAINEAGTLFGKNGMKVQLLYCLENMHYWRGEVARATKETLKKTILLIGQAPKE